MPLSTPAPRHIKHTRTIQCRGYEREDGLWDIEGHMTDVKTYAFPNRDRGGEIKAGEPVHGMWLRITIDDHLLVHAAESWTEYSPFNICPEINDAYGRLVGLRIGPGWKKHLKERLGGTQGCTHLTELLGPMATTAFQTVFKRQQKSKEEMRTLRRPPALLDTCHGWSAAGPVVAWLMPQFHRPRPLAAETEADGIGHADR